MKIEHLYPRADGYYWPQCDVYLDNLRECMQEYIDQKKHLTEFKKAARMYAEKNLDLEKNGKNLPAIFNQVIKRRDKKHFIEQRVKTYESKRLSYLQKLNLQFPHVFKVIRLLRIGIKKFNGSNE